MSSKLMKKKDDKKTLKKKVVDSDSGSETDIYESEDIQDTETESEDEDDESEYETVTESEETEEKSIKKSKKQKTNKNQHKKLHKHREEDEEEEYDEDDVELDDRFDKKQFHKTLLALFPSEYSKNKYMEEDDEEEEDEKPKKSKKLAKSDKKSKKENRKNNKSKKREESSGSESDYDSEYDSDYIDGEEDEDDPKSKTLNLILSMGGMGGGDMQSTVEQEYEQLLEDDRNETCNSDDEKMFMKESYVPIDIPKTPPLIISSSSENSKPGTHNKKVRSDSKKSKSDKNEKNKPEKNKNEKNKDKNEKEKTDKKQTLEEDAQLVDSKYLELTQLKRDLTEQLAKKPGSKILRNAIQECKESIAKLIKKTRIRNTKEYYKLVNGEDEDKQNQSELAYFKKKCSHKEQMRIMRDLREINSFTNIDKPYRLSILESNIPPKYKAVVLQKLKMLRSMEPGDSEYFKLKNWVDGFMRVPFGVYKSLTVKISDGVDVCHSFIENAKKTLDDCVFGLNDAKLQILQMVGQWIANPSAMGTAIAIQGPPGTGKTTLVKDGISKILGREFSFIALGGASDSSFLEGHSYTYEGSSWGKIIQILMDSRCMNPVIYFDELDKISDTPKGEEITNILIHLTDITQNDQYHDKYFSEVSFRLSQCLFIFSYNDESRVNPILKDRMYRIHTKGYDAKEKIIIARRHLLPKICQQVNFKEDEVIIPDDTLQYIINCEYMCQNEQGVRNLKRCLEIIHTKLNLFRLVKSDAKLFDKDIELGDVTFPFTVTRKHVATLIKNDEPINYARLSMYI
jgi:ATP-dependent Lon protease